MNEKEVKDFVNKIFLKNEIFLTEEEIDKLYLYMKNLNEWNEKINLTAIKEEQDIVVKHFLDSIIIQDKIKGTKILDIGSGAGFPGIPLKIFNNSLDVTLIDAVNKKVIFMKDTIERLKLKKIIALHGRVEDYGHEKKYRESFDTVVSRAVANMSTLVEYMLPFVKVGGICLCMKGPDSEEEINVAKNAIKKLGGQIEEVINYKVEDNERCLVIISKIKNTEQTYPRKQGKPLKNPIKWKIKMSMFHIEHVDNLWNIFAL